MTVVLFSLKTTIKTKNKTKERQSQSVKYQQAFKEVYIYYKKLKTSLLEIYQEVLIMSWMMSVTLKELCCPNSYAGTGTERHNFSECHFNYKKLH